MQLLNFSVGNCANLLRMGRKDGEDSQTKCTWGNNSYNRLNLTWAGIKLEEQFPLPGDVVWGAHFMFTSVFSALTKTIINSFPSAGSARQFFK